MTAKINVPRAELAALVGLPADASDEALNSAIERMLAESDATKAAAARASSEARLEAEDRQIVAAAVNQGKISLSRQQFWLDALKRDRAGNRAVIASLAPGLRPTERVVADPEVAQVHDRVMARLGIKEPPRTVAASEQPPTIGSTAGPVRDGLGLPIPPVPQPVRLVRGKPPEQWTQQERDDAALYALGPRFAAAAAARGIPRPPGSSGYYQPTGVEPYEPVDVGGGQIEWRAKDRYIGRI